ncbi:hypothetical protein JCM10207_006983 [Rhodosporidiobolus poonsookiae]
MLAFALTASSYFLPAIASKTLGEFVDNCDGELVEFCKRLAKDAATQLLEAAATHAYTAEDRDSILALRPSPPAATSSPSRSIARNDKKTRSTTAPVPSRPAPSFAEARRSSKTRSLSASTSSTSRAAPVAAPRSASLATPTATRTTRDLLVRSPRSTRPIKTVDTPKRTTAHARKVAHLTARLAAPAYSSLPATTQAAAREHGLKLIDLEEPRERELAALRLKTTIRAPIQVTARDGTTRSKFAPGTLESREARMARFADRLARWMDDFLATLPPSIAPTRSDRLTRALPANPRKRDVVSMRDSLLRRVHGCAHRRADEWVANGLGKFVK